MLKSKELILRVSHVNYVDFNISLSIPILSQRKREREREWERKLFAHFYRLIGESYHHINVFITNVLFMTREKKKYRQEEKSNL